jgi:PBSX family phage terminase large subunit
MTFKAGSFSEKQLDVMLNPDETINALVGSVRSGKTIASLFSLVFLLPKYPHGNILLIGKTDKTLYRNIIKPLQEIFGENEVRFSRGTGEGVIFGHPFFATGANDEKAITKIQGLTLSLAYGDEVTTWPENFFNMLISRLSDKDAKLICTMNPEGPYHWFKVNFLDREEELSLKSWLFLLDENKNLDPKYVVNLKKFYTGLFYRRYVEGAWVLAEGAIYDMFDEPIHVAPVTQDIWRNVIQKYVSIDYGTTNKCVFQLWGIYLGKRYLKKEYCYDSKEAGRQKTDSQYANDLIDFIGAETINQIIIDPSAASFKAELNFRNLSVFEADNEVLDGIRMVATELGLKRIQIDPSCTNCIQEFTSYVWDIKASEKGEDKPLKTNDHSMDCVRYFCKSVPIDDYTNVEYKDEVGYSIASSEGVYSGNGYY